MKKWVVWCVDRFLLFLTAGLILMYGFPFICILYNKCHGFGYRYDTLHCVLPVVHIEDVNHLGLPKDDVAAAVTIFNVVFFDPEYYHDKNTRLHENTHIKQLYRYGVIPTLILGRFSYDYKVMCEYEAYSSENMKYTPEELVYQTILSVQKKVLFEKDELELLKEKHSKIIAKYIEN